jgi:DNA-directed RNA polymerase subunit RPC12/RpoP
MSRSNKRNTDELEQLRSENRQLKAIAKSLEREIKKLNKEYREDLRDVEPIEDEPKESKTPRCTDCGKGNLTTTDLGVRKLISCSNCGKRKTVKS